MRNYHAVLFVGLGFTAGWAFGDVRIGVGIAAITGLVLIAFRALIWAVATNLGQNDEV